LVTFGNTLVTLGDTLVTFGEYRQIVLNRRNLL
jgi:hypothetical protein